MRPVQILSFSSEASSLLSPYKLLVSLLKKKKKKSQTMCLCMLAKPQDMHGSMKMNFRRMNCLPSTVWVLGIKQAVRLGSNLAEPFPLPT